MNKGDLNNSRKKLKILQLTTRNDWAGAQKVLYMIVKGILEYYPESFNVEVAYGQGDGRLVEKLDELGVKHHFIKHLKREISPLDDIKAFFEIYSLIRKNRYDIVHVHSSKAAFLGRIAAKLAGVKKVIYTIHGFWGIEQYSGFKKKLLILAERFAAHFTDKIVLLCNREKEKARKYKIGKESQYVVIPNAVIPEEPYPKGKLRKELGVPDDVKIIGNVARLDRPKNPMRFLKIAEEVLKKRDDVVFVWIGGSLVEDYYGKKVKEYLETHPELKEKIFFLGFREDATRLMNDFDVLLLTSDEEGMPLVVLEALSQGVPVVSTDVGCLREMVEHLGRDEKELADQVLHVLEGSRGRVFIDSKNRSFDEFIHNYAKIYILN